MAIVMSLLELAQNVRQLAGLRFLMGLALAGLLPSIMSGLMLGGALFNGWAFKGARSAAAHR
jgi:hypothetical protein